MIRKLFVFILSVSMLLTTSLCGCSKLGGYAKGSWTVALYLCGSNLETKQGWASKTLTELLEADLPDNVNFVIQTGGCSKWRSDYVTAGDNKRLLVREDDFKDIGAGEFDSMGEAKALADFLAFCAKEYPAERTAVILWNHGGGPIKGACFDETANFDTLTLDELSYALASGVKANNGRKYDIIGFDACLMASIETAVTVSGYGNYMVASEEIESGAGWDYSPIIKAMGDKLGTEEVAKTFCDGYMKKCESKGKSAAATLSVVDLAKTDAVADALCSAVDATVGSFDDSTKALRSIAFRTNTAEAFGGSTKGEGSSNLIDLYGMAKANSDDSVNGSYWKPLMDAIDDAVLYSVHGAAASGANGISV